MNSKSLMGIAIAVIVVIGAVVLLKGQPNNQTTAPSTVESTSAPATSEESTPVPSGIEGVAKETTVNVTANGFDPATVTVKVGSKVTWVNKSGGMANVSSDKHPTHLLYPPINLGSFDDGKSVSLVFDKAGTYTYHNHLDSSQTGTVVIE